MNLHATRPRACPAIVRGPVMALARLLMSMIALGAAVHAPAMAAAARWEPLATPLFEHVGLEQGLPHPVGMALAQDGDGYIWIGTQNGLARWDGYRMRNFYHSADDAGADALPGDFIQALHTDNQGRLWIGTAGAGVFMYDKHGEGFVRLGLELGTGAVNAIASDARGNLWIGTPNGLKFYDTNARTVRRYTRADLPGLADDQIRSLLMDRAGTLWIGTGSGLARLRPGGAVTAVAVTMDGAAGWRDSVLALGENSKGQIAFGTLKSGLGLVDNNGATARIARPAGVSDIGANMVLGVIESVPGTWLASTYGGGLVAFDTATGHGERIQHQPAVSFSLSNDRAAALLRDRSGLVWATTERGVDLYDPHSDSIDSVFGAEGMLEAGVSALMTDSAGDVWVALADHGIDIVPATGPRRAALRPDPAHPDSALPNRVVLALEEAEGGEAWIGTQLGLYRSAAHGRQVRRVALPQTNPYPRIGTILARQGLLWLGTFEGLLVYDPAANTIKRYGQGPAEAGGLTDERIHAVVPDADGALWIATRNGLNRIDPDSGRVEHILAEPANPHGLAQAVISALAIDSRGRLWVGTYGGGIGVLTGRDAQGAPQFERVGAAAGLKAGVITALQADRAGRIWAATSDGIAVIDALTLKARALGRPEGLAFRTFFVGASTVTAEQELLFGATSGLAVVYPGRLNDWGYRPPLVVSEVRLDQRVLAPRQLRGAEGPTLTVPPEVRNIEIELAALDYSAPQSNRYAYLLEGFDRRWIEVDASRRIASYTNLPPGSYRLRLRGSNREGLWNAEELSLRVEVLPAWHETWWAWFAYFLALCVLCWFLFRWRVRQLHHTSDILQGLVYSRTRHLEKLNAIVRSVNEQMDFDALLHTILHESTAIRGIDTALALVREAGTDRLRLHAAWGRIDGPAEAYGIGLADAALRYAPADKMIAPDIFEVHYANSLPGDVCALLAVRVVIDGQVEGYLVYENYQYQAAFRRSDLELLKALKEPFVSAYQKARALRLIEQARANAEAATRAKSDFLANISHEIRTPMNAILGFAGLGTHLDLPAQPMDYFRKIGRAGQSLLEIINDVLDFSKIESGKLELEALPFDLPDTLNQIADLFSWRAAERGLELVIWAAPDVPSNLLGDPLRLSQILVNLVGNALKFTARGHIELRVELDREPPAAGAGVSAAGAVAGAAGGLALRFTVEDTGLGISEEQQSRLFQAFAQADASTTRLYGGTGLGLAISQQLVRKMGGVIRVDSEPGVGSSFSFSVRLQPYADQTPRLPPLPPAALGKRVLVADDSEAARHMFKIQLSSLGLAPRAVASGAAAVAAMQLDHYDVLLIDADMPDLDGIDTLRRIAGDPELAAVPAVLMVTAYAREKTPETAEQARRVPYLDKPASLYQLRGAVLAALGLEAAAPAARLAAAPSLAVQRIRGAHVLVVDDNSINQQVASEILQRAGVRADLAGSGQEAARMTFAGAYDAVLMDIQMPDMDGYQATALIRASGRHDTLPIIAMTAHAVAGYRERCLALDMNDYVTKPIDPDTLYAVLATWVRPDPQRAAAAAAAMAAAAAPPGGTQAAGMRPAGARPAAVRARPGLDMEAALERLGGHEQLLSRLLILFAKDFDASLARIRLAIAGGDDRRAADLVHKIRGAAGNISANELFTAAGLLEDELRERHAAPSAGHGNGPVADGAAWAAFERTFTLVMEGARAEGGARETGDPSDAAAPADAANPANAANAANPAGAAPAGRGAAS